jgi:hypothetical protein
MIRKVLFSLFILLSLVVPTATEKSFAELYTLLSRTTLATMSKEVFLIRNFEVVNIPRHVKEIEANIDSLSYRLTSLRYTVVQILNLRSQGWLLQRSLRFRRFRDRSNNRHIIWKTYESPRCKYNMELHGLAST